MGGEPLLNVRARLFVIAVETADLIQSTVQINHAVGAGLLVKPIDVLRDDARDDPAVLQFGEVSVSVIW